MTPDTILATIHNTPTHTWRAAAVAAAATFVVAGSIAGNALPASSTSAAASRDEWPACTLFTDLARDKLKAKGHNVVYRPVGARGGFYWLDGTLIGNASGEDAPFMACATEKVIAPIRDVPRY